MALLCIVFIGVMKGGTAYSKPVSKVDWRIGNRAKVETVNRGRQYNYNSVLDTIKKSAGKENTKANRVCKSIRKIQSAELLVDLAVKRVSTERPVDYLLGNIIEYTTIDYQTYGDRGRLKIPDLGINVAVYEFWDNWTGQAVVDRFDSAGWYSGARAVVMDHWCDGFDGIKRSIPGETLGWFEYPDGTKRYILCQSIDFNGHNSDEVGAYDSMGQILYDKVDYDLCMYTCNDHWTNITVVNWNWV